MGLIADWSFIGTLRQKMYQQNRIFYINRKVNRVGKLVRRVVIGLECRRCKQSTALEHLRGVYNITN